jgi:hypothetical protein
MGNLERLRTLLLDDDMHIEQVYRIQAKNDTFPGSSLFVVEQ